jgi:SAM-dependent methyltransferase
MPHPDAVRWNRRYQQEGLQRINRPPNPLLRKFQPRLIGGGLALDTACGLATNGRFLAGLGWRVIGLDISLVALELSCQAAHAQQLPFSAAVMDLSDPWLPDNHFDLLMNFRFLERKALPTYRSALKPGGLLFFETFLQSRATPTSHPEFYLQPGELQAAFATFEVLSSGTRTTGGHRLDWLVARKPTAG